MQSYKQLALSNLKNLENSKILEVRGEDIPLWMKKLKEKGQTVIGLTGEDLYKEFCLSEKETDFKILKRIIWEDKNALYNKPALCLIGSNNKNINSMSKKSTICISSKYKNIANNYLNILEKKGFVFDKIYFNGCIELSCCKGISDVIIDIVYTGNSLKKYGLKVYEKIMESDFLIISSKALQLESKESYINQSKEVT